MTKIPVAEFQAMQGRKPTKASVKASPAAKDSAVMDDTQKDNISGNRSISVAPIQDTQTEALALSDIKYLLSVYLSENRDNATIAGLNLILKENRIKVELLIK